MVKLVAFQEADVKYDDDGELIYTPKREIMVNPDHVEEIRDNAIYFTGRKVYVMDPIDQILCKLLR